MNAPAVVKQGLPALQMDDKELMSVLQNSLYPGAKEESIKLVLGYCRASGLDPMQKPVHIVPMYVKGKDGNGGMRDVVMPGIGLYRTQATRSGAYAGASEPEFGEDVTENIGSTGITYPRWCKVTIKRQMPNGAIVEFTAKEFWKENYATAGKDSVAPNAMWRKRPYAQLAKCCEAQALRKAFPEIGSAPTAEEMEGKPLAYEGDVIDARTGEVTPPGPQPYSAEKFAANLPQWAELIRSGKKTADQIIGIVTSKATLTDEQKAAIRTVKPAVDAEFVAAMEGAEE